MAQSKRAMSAPRNAVITPKTIEKGNTVNGVRYTKMVGATVSRPGMPDMTRTCMAFGRENNAVARMLKEGKAVEVQIQFDGATVRVLGKAIKKAG